MRTTGIAVTLMTLSASTALTACGAPVTKAMSQSPAPSVSPRQVASPTPSSRSTRATPPTPTAKPSVREGPKPTVSHTTPSLRCFSGADIGKVTIGEIDYLNAATSTDGQCEYQDTRGGSPGSHITVDVYSAAAVEQSWFRGTTLAQYRPALISHPGYRVSHVTEDPSMGLGAFEMTRVSSSYHEMPEVFEAVTTPDGSWVVLVAKNYDLVGVHGNDEPQATAEAQIDVAAIANAFHAGKATGPGD